MGYLADAHRDWHTVYPDRPWDCPLDCGMADALAEAEEARQEEEERQQAFITRQE